MSPEVIAQLRNDTNFDPAASKTEDVAHSLLDALSDLHRDLKPQMKYSKSRTPQQLVALNTRLDSFHNARKQLIKDEKAELEKIKPKSFWPFHVQIKHRR